MVCIADLRQPRRRGTHAAQLSRRMSAAAKDGSPLDLDGGEFSALMHEVVRFLAAFLHQLPVTPFMQPDGTHLERPVDASLCVGPAESGRPLQDLLRIIGTAVSSGIDTASGGAL